MEEGRSMGAVHDEEGEVYVGGGEVHVGGGAVSYTHLTLPTNREV